MQKIISFFVPLALVLMVSCRDYTTTSIVASNGRLERTIQVKADSNLVFGGAYPVPRDSSWRMTWQAAATDTGKVIFTATKTYASARALTRDLAAFSDSLTYLQLSVRLDRRFRWFHTYLTYHEIYKGLNLFTAIPQADFLTAEELARFNARDTSADLVDRLESWRKTSMYEEIYQALQKTIAANPAAGLAPQALQTLKDSLFKVVRDSVSFDKDFIKKILASCSVVFPTAKVDSLRPGLTENLALFKRKLDLMDKVFSDNYALNVRMPGLIITTNADTLAGNGAHWTIAADSMLYRDYDAWVEARVVNSGLLWGTFVLLGILFALFAGLWIYRRNKNQQAAES